MTREIKFRAWNGKEMHYIGGLENIASMGDWRIIDQYKSLMQYTGLKDKNGKEIYEGDVVEFEGDVRLPIQWAWNSYNFYGPGSADWDITNHTPEKDFEVIGNIYENPELLTA